MDKENRCGACACGFYTNEQKRTCTCAKGRSISGCCNCPIIPSIYLLNPKLYRFSYNLSATSRAILGAPGVGFEPTWPRGATSCWAHDCVSRLAPYLARRPRLQYRQSIFKKRTLLLVFQKALMSGSLTIQGVVDTF